MKKLAYILAIALMGIACNKETAPVESPEGIVPEGKVKLVITVPAGIDSKVSVDGKHVTFTTEDQIAVIGTLNNVTSVVTLNVESVSANTFTFSTVIDADMEIGDYAYYPATIVNKDNPTRINWPSSFDGTKNQMPLMAKIDVTNNQAVFHHLGALLKVTLASAPAGVNALEFTTSSNFVGSYDVVFTDDALTSVTGYALSSNVESITATSTGTYYIPVPAGTYADFQLAMKQGTYYHKQKTASLASPITPAVGNMVNLGTFTYDVDEIEEWWYQSDVNGWNNGYNRFIKTGATTYQLTSFNPSGNKHWKLMYGSDSTPWNVENNAEAWSGILIQQGWTFYRTGADDKTFWITLSQGDNSWTYNSNNWDTNSDRGYGSDVSIYMSTSMDADDDGSEDWDNISLTKYDYGQNYCYKHTGVVIPDNEEYKFKFRVNGSNWEWWIGGESVNISDGTPYATAASSGGDDMTFTLTPGTYDIYLDIAVLNFMFVKQPYTE